MTDPTPPDPPPDSQAGTVVGESFIDLGPAVEVNGQLTAPPLPLLPPIPVSDPS